MRSSWEETFAQLHCMITLTDGPVTLRLPRQSWLAGDILQGEITLDVVEALSRNIDWVRVRCRGYVDTMIHQSFGQGTRRVYDSDTIFQADTQLWQASDFQGSESVVRLPFTFGLPQNLPPSFQTASLSSRGTVSYWIEVHGHRPGMFKSALRLRAPIAVIPRADPVLAEHSFALMEGKFEWRTQHWESSIREHFWKKKSLVSADLALPAFPALPIGVPIPFKLFIRTETKPMKSEAQGAHLNDSSALFPDLPPIKDVELKLKNSAEVTVHHFSRNINDDKQDIGRFGPDARAPEGAKLCVQTLPAEWLPAPDDADMVICARTMQIDSGFTLHCAPSFETRLMTSVHFITLVVPFPGLGNSMDVEMPICLAGVVQNTSRQTSDNEPSEPPPNYMDQSSTQGSISLSNPVLELPPAYWSGEDRQWDEKEEA